MLYNSQVDSNSGFQDYERSRISERNQRLSVYIFSDDISAQRRVAILLAEEPLSRKSVNSSCCRVGASKHLRIYFCISFIPGILVKIQIGLTKM